MCVNTLFALRSKLVVPHYYFTFSLHPMRNKVAAVRSIYLVGCMLCVFYHNQQCCRQLYVNLYHGSWQQITVKL